MMLVRVEYEFFDFEEPSSTASELARQIRLEFSDTPTLFVSWTWERQRDPDCEPYSVAYAESSYFSDRAASVLDVSGSPSWSRHIGRDVELAYTRSSLRDADYQVLEVRSGAERTFVYSLGADRVRISNKSPV